ncbi:MAG: hypothetical protein ACSLFO_05345 [Acidimicrobiales bacterium]
MEQDRRAAALEAIVADVYQPLPRYLRRRAAADDLDDVLNDALLAIWRRLDDVSRDAVLSRNRRPPRRPEPVWSAP